MYLLVLCTILLTTNRGGNVHVRHGRGVDQQTSQDRHEAADPHHPGLRHQLRYFDYVHQRWFGRSLAVRQLYLLDHISNFFIYLDVIGEFMKKAKNMQ